MTEIELRQFIERETWTFAKTYADKAPHEYVVRSKQKSTDEEFMAVVNYIAEHGITMYFWDHPNRYIFVDGYQYWVMKDSEDDPTMVLNRCNLEEYKLSIEWMGNQDDSAEKERSYMTEEELRKFVANESWIFARTYANRAPHEYVVRHKTNASDEDFMRIANHIQDNGVTMYFWNRPNRYIFLDGHQYWAMKGEDGEFLIINRCNLEQYKLSIEWMGKND